MDVLISSPRLPGPMIVLCVAEKPSISKSITNILSGGQFRTVSCIYCIAEFPYPPYRIREIRGVISSRTMTLNILKVEQILRLHAWLVIYCSTTLHKATVNGNPVTLLNYSMRLLKFRSLLISRPLSIIYHRKHEKLINS